MKGKEGISMMGLAPIYFTLILATCGRASAADIDPDAIAEKAIPSIESGPRGTRLKAVAQLASELSNDSNKGRYLSDAVRTDVCKHLMQAFASLDSTSADDRIKGIIAETIVAHCRGTDAKQFIYRVMDTASPSVKQHVLAYIGHPDGMKGDDIYHKISEWSDKGFIPRSARPAYWAKLKGSKAVPDILEILNSSHDREEVLYAAWALQGVGSNEDMKLAFRKADEFKLDKPFRDAPNGLFWVKGKKLVPYVEQASGEDLKTILRLMAASSTLTPKEIVPVLIGKMDVATGETASLVVQRLVQAAHNPRIDHDQVLRALRRKLSAASDARSQGELSGAISAVENSKASAQQFREREKSWVERKRM